MQTYEIIEDAIRTILTERDDEVPQLKPETQISASGLDSLDVAAPVSYTHLTLTTISSV